MEEQDKKIEEENAKVDIKLQNQHQKHMEVEERLDSAVKRCSSEIL